MRSTTHRTGNKGFSLLEVLVTVVILSVALLGLAGLMLSSMRNNHSAYQRSQATWLAYDIIDRARANRNLALAGSYNIALTAPAPTPVTATSPDSPPAKSPIQVQDLAQWRGALAQALPGGTGSVAVTPANRTISVVIQWDDSRGAGGGTAQQFRVDSQL